MNKEELNALCILLMVSDPNPIMKSDMELLEAFADKESKKFGFETWIDFYHRKE